MNSSHELPRSFSNLSLHSELSARLNEQVAFIKSNFHKAKQELMIEFENQVPPATHSSTGQLKALTQLNKLQDNNRSKAYRLESLKQQLQTLKPRIKAESSTEIPMAIESYKNRTEKELNLTKKLQHVLRREEQATVMFI